MTRYTINIGDDFPIGDDDEPGNGGPAHGPGHNSGERRRGPRFGTVLRVLFAVSLIAVVVHHAFQVVVITGLILLLRRHPRFQELRNRMRGMSFGGPFGGARDAWRRNRREHRRDRNRDRDDRGYGSFV